MEKRGIGFALCGSYCTYEKAFAALERLCGKYEVTPIMSENAVSTDSRFGEAREHIERLRALTGREPICTITGAEPVGPKRMFDILVIAPCTGNTMAKLANGITDTAVTMAAKSHLRNGGPLLIAPSTNDGLSASAQNIAALLCRKNIYFVPFGQDDPVMKPTSLVADYGRLEAAIEAALAGRQAQPMLVTP